MSDRIVKTRSGQDAVLVGLFRRGDDNEPMTGITGTVASVHVEWDMQGRVKSTRGEQDENSLDINAAEAFEALGVDAA